MGVFASASKKLLVGTARFELATSRTPSVRATRLRYVPTGEQGTILQRANPSRLKPQKIRLRKVAAKAATHKRAQAANRGSSSTNKAITAVREASRKRARHRADRAVPCG